MLRPQSQIIRTKRNPERSLLPEDCPEYNIGKSIIEYWIKDWQDDIRITENIGYRTVLPDGKVARPMRDIARNPDFAGYRNYPGG